MTAQLTHCVSQSLPMLGMFWMRLPASCGASTLVLRDPRASERSDRRAARERGASERERDERE